MELSEMQRMHERLVEERGWDALPASLVFVHLVEELSEIGRHILFEEGYKKAGMGDSTRKKNVESEVAQVMSLLLQLASHFGVDAEKAFLAENMKIMKRFPAEKWKKYIRERAEKKSARSR